MNPRVAIYIVLGMLVVIQLCISLWGWMRLRRFLNEHPLLATQLEFDEFKRVVKSNMYLALAFIGLVIIGVLTVVAGLTLGGFTRLELLLVSVVLGGVYSSTGGAILVLERRMKSLDVDGTVSQDEYERVVKTWTSNVFPDW